MKRPILFASVSLALLTVGCKKKDEAGAPAAGSAAAGKVGEALGSAAAALKAAAGSAAAAAGSAVTAAGGDLSALVGTLDGKPIPPDVYEKLILATADCKIVDYSIDGECPAYKQLSTARQKSQTPMLDMAGMNTSLGMKLISHGSPVIRVQAAGLLSSVFGTDGATADAVAAAATAEQDPAVLRAMIRTVANSAAKHAKVGEMLLAQAGHAEPKVRNEVIWALSSTWNREFKAGVAKLAEIMVKEADPKVKQTACEYAGKLGDEALLPAYEQLTAPGGDEALAAACLQGLATMWASYPFFDTHSQKAYDLTVKLLGRTPRTDAMPPWSLMGDFAELGKASNEAVGKWTAKNTWFKASTFRKVLGAVVTDQTANWMARTGAIESLVGLGASKAELEALRKGVVGTERGNSHVGKALDEEIAKAK